MKFMPGLKHRYTCQTSTLVYHPSSSDFHHYAKVHLLQAGRKRPCFGPAVVAAIMGEDRDCSLIHSLQTLPS